MGDTKRKFKGCKIQDKDIKKTGKYHYRKNRIKYKRVTKDNEKMN